MILSQTSWLRKRGTQNWAAFGSELSPHWAEVVYTHRLLTLKHRPLPPIPSTHTHYTHNRTLTPNDPPVSKLTECMSVEEPSHLSLSFAVYIDLRCQWCVCVCAGVCTCVCGREKCVADTQGLCGPWRKSPGLLLQRLLALHITQREREIKPANMS